MKPEDYFSKVCKLIESGFTISEALDELKLDSRKFYDNINKKQRIILKQLTTANSGKTIHHGYADLKDIHEFFTTDYAY